MINTDETYRYYLDNVDIQEVLIDAGYHHYKRDGLRYPSYVALDSDGRRISGDKFLVTANGKCCFKPPEMRRWNVVSFIKEHPSLFKDYQAGMKPDRLVHLVCRRLLNEPMEIRNERILSPQKDQKPFNLADYELTRFNENDAHTTAVFQKLFGPRGINIDTQKAFLHSFMLAKYEFAEGKSITNLAFPLHHYGSLNVKGLEMRGFPRKDGGSYKGLAKGTDATRAVWVGNPGMIESSDAKHVYWFESAYDAMAFYQIKGADNPDLKDAFFVSTSGNPSVGQMSEMMKACPNAAHHICFDNDLAGRQFHANFIDTAQRSGFTKAEDITIPKMMKDYVSSLGTLHELHEPHPESAMLLPKELKDYHDNHLVVARETLVSMISEYGGSYSDMQEWQKEDVDFAQYQLNQNKDIFAMMVNDALGLKTGTRLLDIRREIPNEGYKDWNDQLLGKPSKSVEKLVVYQEQDGRQVAVRQSINPSMLKYMESLKDKTNVFSGNKDLLPESRATSFREKVLGLLGIRPTVTTIQTEPPSNETPSPKIDEPREEMHRHR